MFNRYYKEYSYNLGRDVEFMVYGTGGKPCIVFPSQDGRFYDFANFGMIDAIEEFISRENIQVFCIDGIDFESWTKQDASYHDRIQRHEEWFRYVCDELMPRIYDINEETSGRRYTGKAMGTGCSMGAYHALNFFLRRPDIFDTVVSLSGLYNAAYFFPNYNDEAIYFNSPVDYMKNIDVNHDFVNMYRNSNIILCVGTGKWEEECIRDTDILSSCFARLGVSAWIDYWGNDVDHDWPWWKVQLPYFLGRLF